MPFLATLQAEANGAAAGPAGGVGGTQSAADEALARQLQAELNPAAGGGGGGGQPAAGAGAAAGAVRSLDQHHSTCPAWGVLRELVC